MFNDQARSLFKRQYAIHENETLEQGMWRATEPLAHNDVARMLVYEAIMDKRFIPGGRIIAGAGTEHRNTINCYVLGSDTGKYDTLEEVRQLVIKVARTTKVGGGIGINFDRFATAKFASKSRLQVIHYMDAEHPDAAQFIKWQYRDITLPEGYQMKQHVKRSTARHSINPDDCVGATVIKVGDDIESIFNAAFEAAKIEGPVVLDWSALRPEGSAIKGSGGTSSGAASFAIEADNILHWIELGGITAGPVATLRYVFNPVLRSVRQGGTRRGAGMATLSINNLDRELFLNCKDLEVEARLGSIECFNISFLVGDKDVHSPFMEQVATHAWKSGEPGVIFVDAMNCGNPLLKHDGPILSTNPCFTGDMRLLTEDGWITFKDAAEHGKPLKIIQDSRISYVGGDDELPSNWKIDPHNADPGIIQQASHAFLTKRNAEVVQLEFADGTTLRLTPDHLVATTIGMIEAQNLTEMHEVLIGNAPETESIAGQWPKTADEHMGFLMGLLASDGTYDKGKTTEAAMIDLFNEAIGIEAKVVESIETLWHIFSDKYRAHKRPFTPYSITRLPHKLRIKSSFLAAVLKGEYGFSRSTKGHVPKRLMENSRHRSALFYLAAFTYCDGTVNTSCRDIRINQSNKKLLEDIQLMLSGTGISSKVYLRRDARWKSMPDGKGGHKDYWAKDNYELIIAKDRGRFLKTIGILRGTKQDKLEGIVKSIGDSDHKPETTYVLSITPIGREDVYCIHESVRRSLIVEKVCARRCGEIPLYRGEACDLGHIVLTGYVKDGKFDFELFSEDIMYYTMFLDANLDYAKFPTDDATRMAQRNRRLGLGITGLAHTLIQLGIQYGSDYSLEFISNIIHIMAEFSAQTSQVLAEELGFPEFNDYAEGIQKRRNIATLTIAPTGTTSMIVDTSSGIEPLFSIVIYRKVGGEYIKLLDPLFFDMLSKYDPPTDMGWSQDGRSGWDVDKCIESIASNHGSLKGLDWVPKQLRFLFVTTHDLEFTDHIKIQATAQVAMNHKSVGNSISKTINLRNEATADDILSAYRMAHELGCKGITVYRDGSRQLQVLNTSEDAQRLAEQYAQECANGSCEVSYE